MEIWVATSIRTCLQRLPGSFVHLQSPRILPDGCNKHEKPRPRQGITAAFEKLGGKAGKHLGPPAGSGVSEIRVYGCVGSRALVQIRTQIPQEKSQAGKGFSPRRFVRSILADVLLCATASIRASQGSCMNLDSKQGYQKLGSLRQPALFSS